MTEKKKFELTPDLINLEDENAEYKTSIPLVTKRPGAEIAEKNDKTKGAYLNLSVPEDFRKEYKIWCAQKGLKQNEALIKMFDAVKNTNLI